MLDKSINFNSIEKFLIDLEISIREYDKSISLIQFGSSLHQIPEANLDLDILLISENSFFGNSYTQQLSSLKEKLIEGKATKGFTLVNNKLANAVNAYVEKQSYFINSKIFIQFVFGPQIIFSSTLFDSNIYLHFKGPITRLEYFQFSQCLPFHSYSIKENYKIISNNFNVDDLFTNIDLSKDLLFSFNKGLFKRVMASNSNVDVKKCIKKMILNYNLYMKFSKGNESLSEIVANSEGLPQLKQDFTELFNKIHQKLQ